MTTTALIASPARGDAPRAQAPRSHPPDSGDLLGGLPVLLSVVPVAGPPVFAYVGFGVVLLLLLVPPFALLATLVAVALVVAAALAALVVVAIAIFQAPFLLGRFLREHRLAHSSVAVSHVREVKARRV
jgi:hypothetical protein